MSEAYEAVKDSATAQWSFTMFQMLKHDEAKSEQLAKLRLKRAQGFGVLKATLVDGAAGITAMTRGESRGDGEAKAMRS